MLPMNDPFVVDSSDEVIRRVECLHGKRVNMVSLDATDLYFNLKQGILFGLIRTKIGSVEGMFTNKVGMSASSFLEILERYLSGTALCFQDRYFVQKDGVCIGS